MLALTLAGAGSAAVQAGVTTINFNTDPAASGLFRELGNGASEWRASGGASGASNDGYLSGNDARGGQQWCLVFKDLEAGLVVKAFKFECDLRIGGGTSNPADGFSVNYVRASDELLTNADNGVDPTYQNFSGAGGEGSLPEEGSRTGLGIGFDTWQSGDHPGGITDVVGISVRVDGALITQFPVPLQPGNQWPGGTYDAAPYRNLAAGSANYTKSMQTGALTTDEDLNGDGVVDAADVGIAQPPFADDPVNWAKWLKNLKWEKFVAELTEDAKVKIAWKGVELTPAGGLAVNYGPSSGRLVFAGRTGGAWEAHHIDNIVLTTIPSDKVVIGAAAPSPIGFSVTVEDSGASVLDPASVALKLNGASVSSGNVSTSKSGNTTTIRYSNVATPFPSGSTNSIEVAVKDTKGVSVSAARTFVVGTYTTLDAGLAVTGVNTSLPGFTLITHQRDVGLENTVARAESQLRGDRGPNLASPVENIEEGPINYNQDSPSNAGNFNSGNGFEDKPIPGIDAASNSDNIAMEILTYLQFDQPGVYTLIFNSDDGFRTSVAKNRREQLNNVILSQFDGGRGASDTAVTLLVPTAGFYPVRSVWFEGGGGANLEWVVQREGKPRALINDGSANSIKAFRAASSAVPAGVVFTSPTRNSGGSAPADQPLVIDIADGSSGTVTQSSIKLTVNGADVSPTISKSGNITTLSYKPSAPFASGATITANVAFSDSTGGSYSGALSYTIASYATIPASMRLADSVVNKSNVGFLFKTLQSEVGLDNRVRTSDLHTRGLLGLVNYADLTGVGANGYFTITGVINFDQTQGNQGRFNGNNGFPEELIPGIPGTLPNGNQSTDNISAEILTVVEFPTAGLYTFSFNSDDGFATWFGHPADQARILAGQFDGGRGASDTFYSVLITQPGLYPVRNIWFEGGGGANLEWYSRKADGSYALVNDTANGGLKAYQYPLGNGPAHVKYFAPGAGANRVSLTDPIKAVIADGAGSVDPSSVTLKLNDVVVPATVSKIGKETTVSFTPALVAGSANTVELTFGDRTVRRSFTAGDISKVAYFIEAEDFNFDNGKTEAAASDMSTYRGGAYAGKAAVVGVDYQRDAGEGSSPLYRIGEANNVPMDVNYAEGRGRGFTDLQVNYKIGWVGGGQWFNYTRTFPAGKYNVHVGLSHGDGPAATTIGGSLQWVTAGSTTANQTLVQLGTFSGGGTGGWGVNRIIPLTDSTGAVATVELSGTQTLRYTTSNGDFDFILLTPAVTEPPAFTKTTLNANGSITIEWTGGGALEAAPSLSGPWAPVPGAASPYTFTPAAGQDSLFGRIRR